MKRHFLSLFAALLAVAMLTAVAPVHAMPPSAVLPSAGGSGGISDAQNDAYSYVRSGQAWAKLPRQPKYVSGRWYLTTTPGTATQSGNTLTAGTIYFSPVYIHYSASINSIAVEISGPPATSTTFQIALYAIDPVTGYPTGQPLTITPDLNTGTVSNGVVSYTLGSAVALPAGMYFGAINVASNVPGFYSTNAQTAVHGTMFGGTTVAQVLNQFEGNTSYTYVGTYGTWPDLTSITPTIDMGGTHLTAFAVKIN